MDGIYTTKYGFEKMRFKWAVIDPKKPGQALTIQKTLEKAVWQARYYAKQPHNRGKRQIVVAIQPENICD
jgi:signal recognition particle receptor subunit beta